MRAADGVQHHPDLDPGLGPLGQGGHDLIDDLAWFKNIGFDVYGVMRLADGREHRGIELCAVGQHRGAVAGVQAGLALLLEHPEQLRFVGQRSSQVVVDARGKEQDEDEPDQKGEADHINKGPRPHRRRPASAPVVPELEGDAEMRLPGAARITSCSSSREGDVTRSWSL